VNGELQSIWKAAVMA